MLAVSDTSELKELTDQLPVHTLHRKIRERAHSVPSCLNVRLRGGLQQSQEGVKRPSCCLG